MLRVKVRYASNHRCYVWSYQDLRARNIHALTRMMKLSGVPDQPFEVYQNGRLKRTCMSLHWIADSGKPEDYIHKPFPGVTPLFRPIPEIPFLR